ncbi:fimbrial protein [Enterobacter wuhouensis]|uniref:fimbrial protein n=1 Tax=Enterobacter wuhouensis TaxID=2529381 RepID=UPI002FCF686A
MKSCELYIIVALCIFPHPGLAVEPSAGWGRVNMQGAIINTACSIAIESREQIIEMETISLTDIVENGHGTKKYFSIELVNCVIERSNRNDWRQFKITFDGNSDGELFRVGGDVSGVGLQITDLQGNVANPGVSLPFDDVTSEDMKLNYILRLISNNKVLKSGYYFLSIRFRLDYF